MQRVAAICPALAPMCMVLALALPAAAEAKRIASAREFAGIAKAVAAGPDRGFYCPQRDAVWISTTNSKWAVAVMLSNCGQGSQTVRFFVYRERHGSNVWTLRERKYEALGTGKGIPCGSRRVPTDIRCARRKS